MNMCTKFRIDWTTNNLKPKLEPDAGWNKLFHLSQLNSFLNIDIKF